MDDETRELLLSQPPPPPVYERDLEGIVALMELAALELHDAHGKFTRAQLHATAQEIAGPEFRLYDIDFAIVLRGAKFLRRVRGGAYVLA